MNSSLGRQVASLLQACLALSSSKPDRRRHAARPFQEGRWIPVAREAIARGVHLAQLSAEQEQALWPLSAGGLVCASEGSTGGRQQRMASGAMRMRRVSAYAGRNQGPPTG